MCNAPCGSSKWTTTSSPIPPQSRAVPCCEHAPQRSGPHHTQLALEMRSPNGFRWPTGCGGLNSSHAQYEHYHQYVSCSSHHDVPFVSCARHASDSPPRARGVSEKQRPGSVARVESQAAQSRCRKREEKRDSTGFLPEQRTPYSGHLRGACTLCHVAR